MISLKTARLLLASALTLSAGVALAQGPTDAAVCTRGSSEALNACLAITNQELIFPGERLEGSPLRWSPVGGAHAPVAAAATGETVRAPEGIGIWTLEREEQGAWTRVGPDVITRVYFAGGKKLNGYAIGRHPGEGRKGRYTPPRYFIEVTKENADYRISENLRLGQFLTKNQQSVWPKYVPLELALVDKLERIALELRKEGFEAKGLHVMSGYRTPQYNGPGTGGRAKFSRHTYGDAADVWIDDDGDGVMDDLNKDGKQDQRDAAFLAEISRRVEAQFPELVGGAGTYRANRSHGPFTHIDVRGQAASWGRK